MHKKRYAYLAVVLLLVIFVILATASVRYKSPTYDEPLWIGVAWYLTHTWRWQDDHRVLFHPPLSFYIHGIPLRLWERWTRNPSSIPPEGKLAKQFPYPYVHILRYATVFTIAKLSMLPLAVLLGWYVYRWASNLYGIYAGILALTLYIFNPYIIAYSTIITSDMTAACFIFLATYYFWKWAKTPSKRHIILAGVTLGLAGLSKVIAILLIPIFCVLYVIVILNRTRACRFSTNNIVEKKVFENSVSDKGKGVIMPRRDMGTRSFLAFGIILCIALLVVETGYLFDLQPVRAFYPEQTSDIFYRLFKDSPIPFGAYINGIRLHQSLAATITRQYFLAGHYSTHSWWYYHLVTFLLKNPLALIVLLFMSLIPQRYSAKKCVLRENFLLMPVVVIFSYVSFFVPLNTSSRFVLAVYPFICVFISRIMISKLLKGMVVRVLLSVLVFWYILSSLTAFPHYLAYCNELIRGTENGYTWFADSSYDWGQDLKQLGMYMQKHEIPFVKLAYFGRAVPAYYGIHDLPLDEPEGCQPTTGLIAISTTKLQGVWEQDHACYHWLKHYMPIDKIGHTIFLYYIDEKISSDN